jgi:aminomethyltransferase
LRNLQTDPAGRVRVGLVCEGKRAAREGSIVTRPGDPTAVVGTVTSGSYCPTLGTAAAMAMVDRAAATDGTRLDVLIRDTAAAARVAPLPFYRRPATRS